MKYVDRLVVGPKPSRKRAGISFCKYLPLFVVFTPQESARNFPKPCPIGFATVFALCATRRETCAGNQGKRFAGAKSARKAGLRAAHDAFAPMFAPKRPLVFLSFFEAGRKRGALRAVSRPICARSRSEKSLGKNNRLRRPGKISPCAVAATARSFVGPFRSSPARLAGATPRALVFARFGGPVGWRIF